MPTVVFLSWRIVINHAVLGTFWHDGPLLVYYCHGLACSSSGLLLSCFIMLRFRFTTVTGLFHVYYMSISYPINKIPLILLSVFYQHVSFLFSSSFLLFYFFVWYSHIESARFVIVYISCVPIHKTKRSMSRLTNPITPTDFFITEIRLSYFHNFFMNFFGSIKIKLCE